LLLAKEKLRSCQLRPTIASLQNEELPLRELLETLLGPEGRRRLKLKHIANSELFDLWDSDLVLRLRNVKNVRLFLRKNDRERGCITSHTNHYI